MNKDDNYYMNEAIKEAEKSLKYNDVPIGAVVVDKDGNIVGRGFNKKNHTNCCLDHAEINAIKMANKNINNWRLNDCRIYVTVKPCLMCYGTIKEARINQIIYGCENLYLNSCDKTINLKKQNIIFTNNNTNKCSVLLQVFFKNVR